jgi:predicted ATPase
MRTALAAHDEVLRQAVNERGGMVFKHTGDGICAAFVSPQAAVDAALDAQGRLDLPVRMGIATGEAELREDDYFGPALNRAARVMAAGHGGQVLVAASTAGLLDHAGLTDLGEHRFAGIRLAERVFQVGDGRFPPLRVEGSFGSNLPAQASSFVGRHRQLAELGEVLSHARVVTLTGVGGVGKTRLALQAAGELLPRYRDGVWLIELAPVVDPAAVVETAAGALGVATREGETSSAVVVRYLRAKELLLVIDNCEHLMRTATGFVSDVVTACPRVSVLATSREGLGVPGEHILAVPSLGLPSDEDTVDAVAAADAVQLFAVRAGQARAGFALTDSNAAAVARLVRRLDGIPLAIELAAARVRSMSPAELAERVDDLFRWHGPAGAVSRQETLERAMDWSYELLGAAERRALTRAVVFAGGFSLRSAEEVIAGVPIASRDVADLLASLVDKSLLTAVDHDGATRFRLLETVRQYARSRSEAAVEADALRRRHAEHYAAFAEEAGEGLRGSNERVWADEVRAELDNLRAALTWAIGSGDAGLALRIVVSFGFLGSTVQHVTATWAGPVIAMPEAKSQPLYPEALAAGGWADFIAGRHAEAMGALREALDAADRAALGDVAVVRVLGFAVPVALSSDEAGSEETRGLVVRRLEIAKRLGDDGELARSLSGLGALCLIEGDLDGAVEYNEEGLRAARRLANPSVLSLMSLSCAMVHARCGDHDRALRYCAEGIEAAERVNSPTAAALCLGMEVWVHSQTESWRPAIEALVEMVRRVQAARDTETSVWGTCLGLAALVVGSLIDDETAATLCGGATMGTAFAFSGFVTHLVAFRDQLRRRLGDERYDRCAARLQEIGPDRRPAFVLEQLELARSALPPVGEG